LHVQDVVRAYRLLLERGKAGEAYNVCSGEGRTIQSVLDELAHLAGIEVHSQVDPERFRSSDIPYLVGDGSKIRALGWAPRYTTTDALQAVLADVRDELR
jgi:GDP-4-dehydro-6-deoxy-D-mannose reductase